MMNVVNLKTRPDLIAALERAKGMVERMTPADRDEMYRAQARSFVRGQMGMGSDRDEAEYAAAVHRGDSAQIARLDAEAKARMDVADRVMTDRGL